MSIDDLIVDHLTLEEARLLANVNARAQRLFEDGYRIRSLDAGRLLIRSAQSQCYTVDRNQQSCSCPFFEKHAGRYPCKHLLGWRKLMLSQRAAIHRLCVLWESAGSQSAREESQSAREESRESPSAQACGEGTCPNRHPDVEGYQIDRYRGGRHWEVRESASGALIAVTLYRKGATEVARRLTCDQGSVDCCYGASVPRARP